MHHVASRSATSDLDLLCHRRVTVLPGSSRPPGQVARLDLSAIVVWPQVEPLVKPLMRRGLEG